MSWYTDLRHKAGKVREWHLNTLADEVLFIQALAAGISMHPSHGLPAHHTPLATHTHTIAQIHIARSIMLSQRWAGDNTSTVLCNESALHTAPTSTCIDGTLPC